MQMCHSLLPAGYGALDKDDPRGAEQIYGDAANVTEVNGIMR